MIPRPPSVLIGFILAISIGLPTGAGDKADRGFSPRRVKEQLTPDKQVRNALAGLIYGLRTLSPAAVADLYHVGAKGQRQHQVEMFMNQLAPKSTSAIVIPVKPRISWNGSEARIQCLLKWRLELQDGTELRWHSEECLRLKPHKGRYVITDADVMPVVFEHIDHPTEMLRLLRHPELNAEGVNSHAAKSL